ncbi:MAG: insulinase family protein [Candidatus Brocadiaceae bacterium]|nr:insulinase family protein [Candidatus Brocadiaceae bacterium]
MSSVQNLGSALKEGFFQGKRKTPIGNVVAVLMATVWMGCFLCYGEDFSQKAPELFRETRQASVFYLDNGMEVILVENHASPMITAFTIVKTGSRNENAATNGSAHFLEHLLFNGTKNRTQEELYGEMDYYGGYNNAHTGPDYTNYMILMPKEFISQGMDIQADMLFRSVLPPEKFEKERGIVIEEIGKNADSPTIQADRHFLRNFYAGTPYERPVLGTVSTITHLKRDDVLNYYQTWYVPNNMILMVIGDFSTQEMVKLVREKYGPFPPGKLPEYKSVQLVAPAKLRIIRANGMGKFPKDRHYLDMGFILPLPASEDFQSLKLLSEFLGGKKDSRLDTLFEQEAYRGLVNSMSTNLNFNRDFSTLQISAELPSDADVDQVVALVIQAVHGMAENPVPVGEIESVLVARATQEIYLQEKLHYYGMMKSGYLAAGGYSFLKSYMDGLMQVTPQSIQKAAAQYLIDQVPVVTLVSPPALASDEITERSPNKYYRKTMENGLDVVVKENHDSRVIGIHLLAKGRSLSEGKDKRGMAELLQRMLLEGGTVKHPGNKLYRELEAIGAEVKLFDNPHIPYDDYYNSPRFAYIRMKVVDAFLEKGLKLLGEMVSQPQLTPEAFDEAKRQILSLSATAASSTPKVAARIFYDNLFQKNPGFGWILGNPEDVEQLQLQEVRDFHNTFYNPANLLLVISGNQPVEEVMKLVVKNLGGVWGKTGWKALSFTPKFNKMGSAVREKLGKSQSEISFANIFEVDEKDEPALHILGDIFSGRLAFNLRETQGLAYTIGMHFRKYQGVRWYCISMGTRPENIARAIDGIRSEISAIRKANFDADEIQKTINAALGRRGMRRLDRVNQAYYISMEVLDGYSPEADDQYAEKLKAVTRKDVEKLARRVFQKDDHLIVIVE